MSVLLGLYVSACHGGPRHHLVDEAPVPISVCDNLTSLDGKTISVNGYLWLGEPAIWSEDCPELPLPTIESDLPRALVDDLNEMLYISSLAPSNRVGATYTGVLHVSPSGGLEFEITDIEDMRIITVKDK